MRKARLERGLTQKRLAELAGLHKNIICKYEAGEVDPGLFSLVCMADALGIGLDEYIGRDKR
jgi:transcriptional regulator with XRE-family HTH domain